MKAIMSISVDPKVRKLLENQAIRENRSMTSIIQTLLEKHFSIPRARPESWTKRDVAAAEIDFQEVDIRT